jgi:hypothetical protein
MRRRRRRLEAGRGAEGRALHLEVGKMGRVVDRGHLGHQADAAGGQGQVDHVEGQAPLDPGTDAAPAAFEPGLVPAAVLGADTGHQPEVQVALQRRPVGLDQTGPEMAVAVLLPAPGDVQGVVPPHVLQAEEQPHPAVPPAEEEAEPRGQIGEDPIPADGDVLLAAPVRRDQLAVGTVLPLPVEEAPPRAVVEPQPFHVTLPGIGPANRLPARLHSAGTDPGQARTKPGDERAVKPGTDPTDRLY